MTATHLAHVPAWAASDTRATPSQMNGHRWRVGCEVTNLSKHPTEVTVEVWVIGMTAEKRAHYVMTRKTENMKLRGSETRSFEVFTATEASYQKKADALDGVAGSGVRFRGCVIQAIHAKGVAGFAGSDRVLTGYADPKSKDSPLVRLPKF